jgi:hypothetical protein
VLGSAAAAPVLLRGLEAVTWELLDEPVTAAAVTRAVEGTLGPGHDVDLALDSLVREALVIRDDGPRASPR